MEKNPFREFRSLAPYLRPYRVRYILGFFFLITVDIAQMLIPQCVRRAVDLMAAGGFIWKDILFISLSMLGIAAVISGGRFLWRYFIHGASRRIEMEIRNRLFEHLLTLSYDFYQENKIGDLMARATNDINAIRMAIGWGFVALIDGTVMALSILIIMFAEDARTSLLAILPLPFITILILCFGRAVGKRFRRAQETYSAMSNAIQETFAGIRVVKSFVKEGWFIKKFADTNDDYREANMAMVRLFGGFFPLISLLSGLTTLILLLSGGRRVVEGAMSPGVLVALFSYLQMLIWPIMGAGFTVNMIQRGAVSLGRINEIFRTLPGIRSPEMTDAGTVKGACPEKSSGEIVIRVKNLSFSYPSSGSSDRKALSGVNLEIRRGDIIGILGKTGSGKSTLLKALVRLIDPPPESVFVDGLDVRSWELSDLRASFGMALQDSYLFSDSIKNNVLYGAEEDIPPASIPALLDRIAASAALDTDLGSFGGGWETLVGERGLTLSGGQKQRVSIGRALIRHPRILILDDAFSAVDAETERRILNSLLESRKGKTTILVSHRVSTLCHADRVLVLDGGKLSEEGTPGELLERGGFYARTAALQRLAEGSVTGE
ncbi:MAG: ABC transporter ATP-binding protein/permease [Spirochaetaceae bacterium]|jgi:ATP-binding cassette subfamily B protein|nr:ABC transporter ATP-binding protein/permease [Spirochaetaceae bacterium]